jgi:hypothetical protein
MSSEIERRIGLFTYGDISLSWDRVNIDASFSKQQSQHLLHTFQTPHPLCPAEWG